MKMEVYTVEEINKAIMLLEHIQDILEIEDLDTMETYDIIEEVIQILAQK